MAIRGKPVGGGHDMSQGRAVRKIGVNLVKGGGGRPNPPVGVVWPRGGRGK